MIALSRKIVSSHSPVSPRHRLTQAHLIWRYCYLKCQGLLRYAKLVDLVSSEGGLRGMAASDVWNVRNCCDVSSSLTKSPLSGVVWHGSVAAGGVQQCDLGVLPARAGGARHLHGRQAHLLLTGGRTGLPRAHLRTQW